MADAYSSTTTLANLVQGAVDLYVRQSLRHTPLLRSVADTRPVDPNMAGSSVDFYKNSDLAPQTTPLGETTDPDAVALPQPTPTTVNLNEYGMASITTIRLAKFAFSNIDPLKMDQIAYNMRDSLDALVRAVLDGGANKVYNDSTYTTDDDIVVADTVTSSQLRKAVTKLRAAAAPPKRGELYAAYLHPEVSHDLKEETGATGWFEAHKYAAPDVFWPNEVGTYAGAFIIESARVTKATNANAVPTEVYNSYILGKEALAEAVAKEPQVEIGVVPDKLNRFFPMGWHGILGWSLFRDECFQTLKSSSSLNA